MLSVPGKGKSCKTTDVSKARASVMWLEHTSSALNGISAGMIVNDASEVNF